MERQSNPTRKYLIGSVLIIVVLAVAGVLLYRVYSGQQSLGREFGSHLVEVDRLLAGGDLLRASDHLEALLLRRSELRASNYLGILKRFYLLAEQTGSWDRFGQVALQAGNSFPGEERITALSVYGLIQLGSLHEASRLARYLKSESYSSLKSLALLRFPGRGDAPEDTTLRPYLIELGESSPQLMEEAGAETGLSGFYLNAALLYLEAGDYESALRVHDYHLSQVAPLFSAYLMLDLGLEERALGYWRNYTEEVSPSVDTTLLGGEIYIRLGRLEEATKLYEDLRRREPAGSPTTYLNLAFIEPEKRERLLLEGMKHFPDSEELHTAYAEQLRSTGRSDEAIALLEELKLRRGLSYRGRLFLLGASSSGRNQNYLRGELWQLVNDTPYHREPAEILAYQLLGWQEYDEVELLLDRVERSIGDVGWIYHLRGVTVALGGDLNRARYTVEMALERSIPPGSYYNQGVILAALGETGEALEALDREIAVEGGGRELVGRSYILSAELAYRAGEYRRARGLLRRGLEHYPDSLGGLLLRNRLDVAE